MKIRNVIHRGLRRLVEKGDNSGLPAALTVKIEKIISFLQDMVREDELYGVSTWKAHRMTGDRSGTWSLFVSRNWRITFRIDREEIEIVDLDYVDYH